MRQKTAKQLFNAIKKKPTVPYMDAVGFCSYCKLFLFLKGIGQWLFRLVSGTQRRFCCVPFPCRRVVQPQTAIAANNITNNVFIFFILQSFLFVINFCLYVDNTIEAANKLHNKFCQCLLFCFRHLNFLRMHYFSCVIIICINIFCILFELLSKIRTYKLFHLLPCF